MLRDPDLLLNPTPDLPPINMHKKDKRYISKSADFNVVQFVPHTGINNECYLSWS